MSQTGESGCPQPERFRHYLALLARTRLGPEQCAKIDPSDIVQQTMLEAHQKLDKFQGTTEAQMAGWLRQMLAFNVADAFRALGRQKRDVARERSLDRDFNKSCSRLEAWMEAVQTSPSGHVCRDEQVAQLAAALSELPESQREAIELHHLHGLSLLETAEHLQRSASAVAGLLRRGLQQLRKMLDESNARINTP